LATPYAVEPAAGICGGPLDGDTATVQIWPDIPEPRCLVVTPEQRLHVTNRTDENIQIKLGPFEVMLAAGETYIFDCPLESYLTPGIHQLLVSPFGGPEILLKD
jgi:hypothetical protein